MLHIQPAAFPDKIMGIILPLNLNLSQKRIMLSYPRYLIRLKYTSRHPFFLPFSPFFSLHKQTAGMISTIIKVLQLQQLALSHPTPLHGSLSLLLQRQQSLPYTALLRNLGRKRRRRTRQQIQRHKR